jgi:hypothetical protein
MANFVVIKGMDYHKRESINDALDVIKGKIVKKDLKGVVSDFTTWYGNMTTIVQAHDLYDIIGTTQSYLEEQRLYVEKFEIAFAQKFTSIYTRKSISKIKDRFKRSCVTTHGHELYFGNMDIIAEINTIFNLFNEYAKIVVNLYKDITDKIEVHLLKEGNELTDFIGITKIKGNVTYTPTLGGIPLHQIPFVTEYSNCHEVLESIDGWFTLQPLETNIPIDDEPQISISIDYKLHLHDTLEITQD